MRKAESEENLWSFEEITHEIKSCESGRGKKESVKWFWPQPKSGTRAGGKNKNKKLNTRGKVPLWSPGIFRPTTTILSTARWGNNSQQQQQQEHQNIITQGFFVDGSGSGNLSKCMRHIFLHVFFFFYRYCFMPSPSTSEQHWTRGNIPIVKRIHQNLFLELFFLTIVLISLNWRHI